MIFYTVECDHEIEGTIAVATLKEAMQIRADLGPGQGAIYRIETLKAGRELLCAIYNRKGFADAMKLVVPSK